MARLEESEEEHAARLQRMADAVKVLLESIGEDVSREGLVKTPMRAAKALLFFTSGYQIQPKGTLQCVCVCVCVLMLLRANTLRRCDGQGYLSGGA